MPISRPPPLDPDPLNKGSSAPHDAPVRVLWITTAVMVSIIAALAYWQSARPQPARFGEDACPAVAKVDPSARKSYWGLWAGKWDDTWAVELEVSDAPAKNGFNVVYRWEEYVGQAKSQRVFLSCLIGDELVNDSAWLTLRLQEGPGSATLLGAFSKQNRKAAMTWQAPPGV